MSKDKDDLLIRAFLRGNRAQREEAFRGLYERYADKVYRTARRLAKDDDQALDIAQETFIQVYRNLRKFKFRSAFSTWLFRIAYNCALEWRRRKGDPAVPMGAMEHELRESEIEDRRNPPLHVSAQRSELREEFRRALDRLGGPHAAVLALRYLDDLTYEEIAGVLGVEIGTVKSRLSRAHEAFEPFLTALRAQFGGDEPDTARGMERR